MSIVNARPRFGLEGNTLFDYRTSDNIPIEGVLEDPVGVWDLPKVAECIREGRSIEEAFIPNHKVGEISDTLAAYEQENQSLKKRVRELEQDLHVAGLRLQQEEAAKEAIDTDAIERLDSATTFFVNESPVEAVTLESLDVPVIEGHDANGSPVAE